MDVSTLIRDPERVAKAWISPPETKTIIAKKPCKIYFPKHYMDGKLGSIDDRFNVMGVFGITIEDKYYCASDALAIMPLTPDSINVVKIDDSEYYVLSFDEGSVICPNRSLVKDKTLMYEVSNEFVAKGKTPWYFNKSMMSNIFKTDSIHGGIRMGDDRSIISITAAFRARNPKDRSQPFRYAVKTQKEFDETMPDYLALNSVAATVSNTATKLVGGYLTEGIVSALVEPSTTVESAEKQLLN